MSDLQSAGQAIDETGSKKKKYLTEEHLKYAELDMADELSEILDTKPKILGLVEEETGNT